MITCTLCIYLCINEKYKTLTTKHLVKAFGVLFPDVPNLFTLPVAEITASEVERYSLYKPESAQDEDPFIAGLLTGCLLVSF
ncbi:hypothetical protein [Pseudoalteromonas sp. JSTW]|uniref:hypothetical protein n=1 Tax=Pseudoalteromonas sp. JSTW TaxID=2752475 RepID=UPI00214A9D65|nr:hypothetical protein [Pseudoalteromonas sp. JSTW]